MPFSLQLRIGVRTMRTNSGTETQPSVGPRGCSGDFQKRQLTYDVTAPPPEVQSKKRSKLGNGDREPNGFDNEDDGDDEMEEDIAADLAGS